MQTSGYILTALTAYLLGSIPTGFLVAKAKGVDIRTVGSGNIGATNVFRIVGKPAGIFVLVVDGLKGYAACTWIFDLMVWLTEAPTTDLELPRIIAGICAVLGHSFTCWLKFKGGKGVATGAGVFFALTPVAAGIALAMWIFTLALTHYASVASIAAVLALVISAWLLPNSLPLRLVVTALGLFVIIKHRSNIARLRSGTEKRINFKGGTS